MSRIDAIKRRKVIFYLEQILQKTVQAEGFSAKKGLLWMLSVFVQVALRTWHFCYDIKIRKPVKVELPVISVGNITLGGTGKTSFTEKLVRDIAGKGVVLSRGYLGKRSKLSLVPRSVADGDEAFMLKKKLGGDRVVVGRRREHSTILGKLLGAECFVLDDGMQYRKLFRDLEIVMIDAKDPFGQGYFLPRGRLRESPRALKRASYVVIHGAQTENEYRKVREKIRLYTKAPCFGTCYEMQEGESLNGQKVGVFCGIGNPEAFLQMLKAAGAEVVLEKRLSDHQPLTKPKQFVLECFEKGATKVLCTEKDYIKIEGSKEITPVQVAVKIVYEFSHYEVLLKEINRLLSKKERGSIAREIL